MAASKGEDRVLATAEHIVRSLGTSETVTDDMIDILTKFDNRFNQLMPKKPSSSSELPDGISRSLDSAGEVIMQWDKRSTDSAWNKMIWDSDEEAFNYLHAVDEVQNILEGFGIKKAQTLHAAAMIRLEDEFRYLLETSSRPVDPAQLESYASCSMAIAALSISSNNRDDEGCSSSSFAGHEEDQPAENCESDEEDDDDDDQDEDVPVARAVTDLNPVIELLLPEVVEKLNDIAKRLVQGDYKRECCQAYAGARRMVLLESLQMLGMEKIDEVQKMNWEVLQGKIRKWIQVMDLGVKVLFASERQLCDQVFDNIPALEEICFAEVSRVIMIQLLNFGEAVAGSRREIDKLITILDMYEKLRDVLPEIHSIFSGEACLSVREEASGVLLRLGEAGRGTFVEFENAIKRDPAKAPVPRGALHPLTRYVMNYLRLLLVYVETLRELFGSKPVDVHADAYRDYYNSHNNSIPSLPQENSSPLAMQFLWIVHLLENNLEAKAKSYKDLTLTNLFLMNNVHYIVQKVRSSELRSLLGDTWTRNHSTQVRQYGKNYERSAWIKVLACLKDEGIRPGGSFSSGVSKAVLKERFKSFNSAFEEIHKTQSTWCVPDDQLRSELRISVAEKLIQAYRAFLGRYKIYLESERNSHKYIKYTPEELEGMVNNLFSGS